MMKQWRKTLLAAAAVCALALVAACGNKPVEPAQPGGAAPLHAADGDRSNGAAGAGAAGMTPEDRAGAAAEGGGERLDPGAARDFLAREGIANGDIYIGEGGLLHINIVKLNDGIRQQFRDAFPESSYKLVDATYTHAELEAAQEALAEHDLYRKLNLYSSSIDVIGNRILITMPDSSDGAQAKIERYVDPAMIVYHVEPLGEPHVVGTIHEIDKAGSRILILEDGKEQPTYWMSFGEHSVMIGGDGGDVAFGDLNVGGQVRIWTTGLVLESMPAQAQVRKLELAD